MAFCVAMTCQSQTGNFLLWIFGEGCAVCSSVLSTLLAKINGRRLDPKLIYLGIGKQGRSSAIKVSWMGIVSAPALLGLEIEEQDNHGIN